MDDFISFCLDVDRAKAVVNSRQLDPATVLKVDWNAYRLIMAYGIQNLQYSNKPEVGDKLLGLEIKFDPRLQVKFLVM